MSTWTREDWGAIPKDSAVLKPVSSDTEHRLKQLVKEFQELSKERLEGKNSVIITAWLVTDNVIADLFKRFTNARPELVAVDTLHIFPETRTCAKEMDSIGLKTLWYKPKGCETLEDFQKKFGHYNALKDDDFDYSSKVEPLQQAMNELKSKSAVVITGRRNDQGNARTSIPTWEEERNTLNPLVDWTWEDVTAYATMYNVPVNSLHKRVLLAENEISPLTRDAHKDFLEFNLDRPYWEYNEAALEKMFGGKHWYVWKSFGDFHTSLPVKIHESERTGRFVKRVATECGIHTRVSNTKKAPHGGSKLVNLLPSAFRPAPDVSQCKHTISLTERQLCDLELLINGGYTPLNGFMTEAEYDHSLLHMRLPEGAVWGLPVVLDIGAEMASKVQEGDKVLLRADGFGGDLAVMTVTSKWNPDKKAEALHTCSTDAADHPYVGYMYNQMGETYIGGPIEGIRLPERPWVRRVSTPSETREKLKKAEEVVAFQCRNPLHKAHVAMFTDTAAAKIPTVVHPAIGPSKDDDFDASVRIPTYETLNRTLADQMISFEYFPYHMRLAGPREAVQHMICRKNYGFTQMIIGRDHAGCKNAAGEDFYGPYDAQELASSVEAEIGITTVPFKAYVFHADSSSYVTKEDAKERGLKTVNISGTEFRRRITAGEAVPDWYAFPDVVQLLQASYNVDRTAKAEEVPKLAEGSERAAVLMRGGDASAQEALAKISNAKTHILFFHPEKEAGASVEFDVFGPKGQKLRTCGSLEELEAFLQGI